MKIQQIKIKNLASLEGEQLIDFTAEPLKNCGLFSIVGPTGSGKSTCLDAVVLSLYGTSPRYHDAVTYDIYNGEKPKNDTNLLATDPRNILRKGCRDCFAQLSFIGEDGDHYLSTWKVEMKQGGKSYNKPLHTLQNLTHPKEITAVQNSFSLTGGRLNEDYKTLQREIIRAVGLDYDQFTRTVMLAQNSFANFLQSNGESKGKLLEKLTGTGVYTRIGVCIYRFYKEASDAKNALEEEMKGVSTGLLDEEELLELKTKEDVLSLKVSAAAQSLDDLKKKLNWYVQSLVLSEKEQQSEQQRNRCKTLYDQNENTRNRLFRRDSVQGVSECYFTLNKLALEAKELVQKVADNLLQCTVQQTAVKLLLAEKNTTVEQREQAEQELEKLQPDLKRYRDLKVLVTSLQDNCRKLNEEQLLAQKKAKEATNLVQAQKKALQKACLQKEAAQKTLLALEQHRSMISSIPAIVLKLDQLAKDTDRLADYQTILTCEVSEVQPRLLAEWKELQQKKEELDKELTHWNRLLDEKQLYLSFIDPNKLQSAQEALTLKITKLKEAQSGWKNLTETLLLQKELTTEGTGLHERVEKERLVVEQLQQQFDKKQAEYQGNEQMYTLVTSQDVDALRAQLIEGERCPVCGAERHPYAGQDHQNNPLLLQMKQQLNLLKAESNEYLQKLDVAKQLYNKHTGLAEANAKEEERLQTKCTAFQAEWAIYAAWIGEEDAPRIGELILQTEEEAKTLSATQIQYNNHQKEASKFQKKAVALDQQLKALEAKGGDIKVRDTASKSKVAHLQTEIEELQTNVSLLISGITVLITFPDWLNEWTAHRNDFKQQLETIYIEYNQADKQVQTAAADILRFQSELDLLQKDQQEKEAVVAGCTASVQKGEADLLLKQNELNAIFAGDTADNREQKAHQILFDRKKAEAKTIARLNEQQSKFDGLRGEQEQLNKHKLKTDENLQSAQETFNQWMDHYTSTVSSLSKDELAGLLSTGTNWEELRANDNRLKQNLDVAAGTLKSDQTNRIEHQKNKPEEEESLLRQAQEEQFQLGEQLKKELITLGSRLAAHTTAQRNISVYRERLETLTREYADWRELNKIFGTVDGKGISEKAQCVTLSYLVGHANVQLRQLTNRYSILQVSDSLGLQIVDHDRGDEARSISTLSGGETFLISLSLALGLSSLSSDNLQIGTMFIDEGFGTLDAHSLSVVIDALSRLQSSQGRQVGVISHTEEMKNNIPIRISILRESAGGRSFIQVEDGLNLYK